MLGSRSTDLEVGKHGEDQRDIVGKVRDSWHNQHDIGNYCKGCSRNGKCIDTCLTQSQLQSNQVHPQCQCGHKALSSSLPSTAQQCGRVLEYGGHSHLNIQGSCSPLHCSFTSSNVDCFYSFPLPVSTHICLHLDTIPVNDMLALVGMNCYAIPLQSKISMMYGYKHVLCISI